MTRACVKITPLVHINNVCVNKMQKYDLKITVMLLYKYQRTSKPVSNDYILFVFLSKGLCDSFLDEYQNWEGGIGTCLL